MSGNLKWIMHKNTKQVKQMKVNDANEFLKSPSWVEVDMTTGKPEIVIKKAEKKVVKTEE